MSCQMLSVEYIAEAANRVKVLLSQNSLNRFGFFVGHQVHEAFADCRDKYGFYQAEQIFNRFYNLNQKAYAGRYKEEYKPVTFSPEQLQEIFSQVQTVPELQYVNYHAVIRPFDFQTLKMWERLHYQLLEDKTAKDPATVALSEVISDMCRWIAHSSDEYEKAQQKEESR